jgi:hypothetical protein
MFSYEKLKSAPHFPVKNLGRCEYFIGKAQLTILRFLMKNILIFCFLFVSFSTVASAGPELLCSLQNSKRVIALSSAHSNYDKNRHCSVSCMLALKCNDQEVMLIGLLKEIKDFFGAGTADQEDLKADAFGISLASKGAAITDAQCLSQCDLYYHQ